MEKISRNKRNKREVQENNDISIDFENQNLSGIVEREEEEKSEEKEEVYSHKSKRHVWSEQKNDILLEFVQTSQHPTPWKPKHGTNEEVWTDIRDRMISERNDVFDSRLGWEALKDQLYRLIEKQRVRRSAGEFTVKSNNDAFLDEMLRHIEEDNKQKEIHKNRIKQKRLKRQLVNYEEGIDENSGEYYSTNSNNNQNAFDNIQKRLEEFYSNQNILRHENELKKENEFRQELIKMKNEKETVMNERFAELKSMMEKNNELLNQILILNKPK